MQVLKVKNSKYDLRDITNAFRLIAGDNDRFIPIVRVKELFRKQGVEEDRISNLITVLDKYLDDKKENFNF